jgi:hypothetical protein
MLWRTRVLVTRSEATVERWIGAARTTRGSRRSGPAEDLARPAEGRSRKTGGGSGRTGIQINGAGTAPLSSEMFSALQKTKFSRSKCGSGENSILKLKALMRRATCLSNTRLNCQRTVTIPALAFCSDRDFVDVPLIYASGVDMGLMRSIGLHEHGPGVARRTLRVTAKYTPQKSLSCCATTLGY